ncbi:PRKC apoptosis WT1 regulator protein [Lepisosteus oculatus]
MATGGFRSSTTTDFLEEWKAKREKMRAKMLGDIAASTGGNTAAPSAVGTSNSESRSPTSPGGELNNNGNPDRVVVSSSSFNCVSSSLPMARSSSSSALRRMEDDPHQAAAGRGGDPAGGNLKKSPPPEKVPSTPQPEFAGMIVCNDSDKDRSPSPASISSKGKEKSKSSGPSARKGKGQIEKRKLREKRRSTGVVSIPSNESLDELDDDDAAQKERNREDAITQQNTVQNEALASDPSASPLLQDTSRPVTSRYKSSAGPASEEEVPGNRYSARTDRSGYSRHNREANPAGSGALERRLEELERELAKERQENVRLLKIQQDKDEMIGKLREEIDLLNRDLDDIEDENEQLKQENKTLLKVVGQLTR